MPVMSNPIPVPERVFYFLLIAPVVGMVAVTFIFAGHLNSVNALWSQQVNDVRERVKEADTQKQELMDSLIENKLMSPQDDRAKQGEPVPSYFQR